jgi:hypothetical protein
MASKNNMEGIDKMEEPCIPSLCSCFCDECNNAVSVDKHCGKHRMNCHIFCGL